MLGSSEEQNTSRRPARQRARRSSPSAAKPERAVRKTTRKRAASRVEKKQVPEVTEEKPRVDTSVKNSSESRKAPTPFSTKKAKQKRVRNRNIILATVLFIGVGSSAAVGMTDSGQINVSEAMEARNERIRNNTADESDTENSVVEVPVQNTNRGLPNSGLIGSGRTRPTTPPPEPEPVATSTATSSDEVATSTDATAENEAETESIDSSEEVVDEAEAESDEPEESSAEAESTENGETPVESAL